MFDFNKPEDGSEERYYKDKKPNKIVHYFWWMVHNCVVHPLIGVAPIKSLFNFHDWTSRKIHQYN